MPFRGSVVAARTERVSTGCWYVPRSSAEFYLWLLNLQSAEAPDFWFKRSISAHAFSFKFWGYTIVIEWLQPAHRAIQMTLGNPSSQVRLHSRQSQQSSTIFSPLLGSWVTSSEGIAAVFFFLFFFFFCTDTCRFMSLLCWETLLQERIRNQQTLAPSDGWHLWQDLNAVLT